MHQPHKALPSAPTKIAITFLQPTTLLLLAWLVYSPVRHFGFIDLDDLAYVAQNHFVQQGFTRESIHFAFTTNLVGNWNPMVWLSFMLDGQLFSAAPGAIHIENVALHAATGIVLFYLLRFATASTWRSWIVAAIFIVHPMHVESVAWISERKDVLSTPLLLGAIFAYCRYVRTTSTPSKIAWHGLMLLLFLLSLMSKPTGVTLPLLLLLLDFWPLRRLRLDRNELQSNPPALLDKIPMVLVTAGFSVLAIIAQKSAGATDAAVALPVIDRIDNAIVCYVIYIVKLVWPTDLAAFYPHPGSRPMPMVICSAGLLAAVSWIAWRLRQRMPWFIVGWLWFIIALLPMIGLVQLGGQAMADRYSYLPSIGLSVAIIWTAGYLLGRNPSITKIVATAMIALATLAALTIAGRQQAWYWKDTRTLFAHSMSITGPNPVASYFMGTTALANGDTHEAIDDFAQVIDKDPGNDKAFELLGNIVRPADPARAASFYQQAVDLQPKRVEYRIALAAALSQVNDRASLQRARSELKTVLQMDAGNANALAGMKDLNARLEHP
jgi:hypothetical protein